jgi:hypothetical protein
MSTEQQQTFKVERKPYTRPELRVYGDIKKLTQARATGLKLDGAPASRRTQ